MYASETLGLYFQGNSKQGVESNKIKLLKLFEYSDCGCIQPCSSQKPLGQLVQYANYKNANSIIEHSGYELEKYRFD